MIDFLKDCFYDLKCTISIGIKRGYEEGFHLSHLQNELLQQFESIVHTRRYLHQHPELSFQEFNTAKFIAQELRSYGIEVHENIGGNGVVGYIRTPNPTKTIALRADFDALPIPDEKNVPYKSTVDGVSHACGHDGHTAALLGVAKVLQNNRDQLKGNVKLIFQHAEEKPPGGAKAMVEAGVLEDVDYIFGAHLASDLPIGTLATRVGPTMASVDAFTIKLFGKGGHGAHPHQTKDSLVIGTQLVNQLQQIVSRRVSPIEPAVVTVGSFHSGSAFNVIADKALLEGTVRTLNATVRKQIEQEIRAILDGFKVSSYVDYELDYLNGYPVLVNHEEQTNLVTALIQQEFGDEAFQIRQVSLGAEDFAYYLQQTKGNFFYVGSHDGTEHTAYPHHHPKFDFDEQALVNIGKVFLKIIEHYLIEEII